MESNDEGLIDPPIKEFDNSAFRKISELGSGGCAQVMLELNIRNQKLRAIKIIKKCLDEKSLQYFKREYTLLLQLNHPAIMRLFDCGIPPATSSSYPWLELEFLPGGTLTEYINIFECDGWKIDMLSFLKIAYGIASAISYIHSKSIVHRDIKPDNILLDGNFEPRLADFGFARILRGDDIISSFPQTVIYAAPEVGHQLYSDDRSDVYSFGLTLYHMRTLKRPFQNTFTVLDIINQKTKDLPNDLPDDDPFKLIISKCTQLNIENRPKMKEVAEIIKKIGSDILNVGGGADLKSFENYCFKIDNNILNEDEGSIEVLQNLASEGSLNAMYHLGVMYSEGIYFEKDINQANVYFKTSQGK